MNLFNNKILNNVNYLIRKSPRDVRIAVYITIIASISEVASIALIAPIISFMVGIKSEKFLEISNYLDIENPISPAILLVIFDKLIILFDEPKKY
jgi:hypothetical protein